MTSSEPNWSCFVVSDDNKEKASYLNAVITNKISSTSIRTDNKSVGLHFNNNNIADSEYRFLDSMFGFGIEFALNSRSRERSTVLSEALKSIPDARLLLVRQLNDDASSSLSLNSLEISAAMPQECVVAYVEKHEQSFSTLDQLGAHLENTFH